MSFELLSPGCVLTEESGFISERPALVLWLFVNCARGMVVNGFRPPVAGLWVNHFDLRRRPVKLRILAATLGAVTLAGGAGLGAVALSRPEVVVERVVDGDTIVVRIGDTTETVHLLNIDAPESTSLDKPVECLGPEAADFLKTRLPEGTVITLKHDKRRWDKHGHLLAGVYESGSLVNAEIAAAGLAAPTVFEPNRQLYPWPDPV
jgi:endonuclease YncB( thermonuclease family)